VGSHGGDPLQGLIGLFLFAIFGVVDDRGLLGEIVHTFLRERGPDEVGGKTFHGALLMGIDPFTAEDIEPGVSPALHHPDELPGDFPFTQQHGKHAMAEEFFQICEVESGSDPEYPLTEKGAVGCQYMQMGMIPIWPLTKGLRGHYRAGDPTGIWDGPLKKPFQRFPCASAKGCQELSVMEEEKVS